MKIQQEWYCDRCQRAGVCILPKRTAVYQALELLRKDHDRFDNSCGNPKLRVRNPGILSRGEWREQVRIWRKAA
jgi:hypothetical protein